MCGHESEGSIHALRSRDRDNGRRADVALVDGEFELSQESCHCGVVLVLTDISVDVTVRMSVSVDFDGVCNVVAEEGMHQLDDITLGDDIDDMSICAFTTDDNDTMNILHGSQHLDNVENRSFPVDRYTAVTRGEISDGIVLRLMIQLTGIQGSSADSSREDLTEVGCEWQLRRGGGGQSVVNPAELLTKHELKEMVKRGEVDKTVIETIFKKQQYNNP